VEHGGAADRYLEIIDRYIERGWVWDSAWCLNIGASKDGEAEVKCLKWYAWPFEGRFLRYVCVCVLGLQREGGVPAAHLPGPRLHHRHVRPGNFSTSSWEEILTCAR
jgi:hypothetical protein